MPKHLVSRLNAALEKRLPEQRLFLKSDTGTRFIRLRPVTQAGIIGASVLLLAWTIMTSAVFMIDSIGSESARAQMRASLAAVESRLDALAKERDIRAAEAAAAQSRFTVAMAQVSAMQSQLLGSEQRRNELETGIGLIQTTLHTALKDRDAARAELAARTGNPGIAAAATTEDLDRTLVLVTEALGKTAGERDKMAAVADSARIDADNIAYEMRLLQDRHDQIFSQIEDALTVSMDPLDKVFASVGINPKTLIADVRRGYSGEGGPVGPLVPSTIPGGNTRAGQADIQRASAILTSIDDVNLYRIAIEKTPLALPLKTSFRFTSPFGRRWGRAHEGIDLAGAYGSPIYATADGVVTHAGWENGYGNMVEIQHPFGLKTRYGHLSKVRASVGQKVSRGDRIGDMGSTGRSTGTHLHYEVRVGSEPVNPLTFIKAATNVF